MVNQVPVLVGDIARFKPLLGPAYEEVESGIEKARRLFAGRRVWHVNSTARGGGVAELLKSLLAYARGGGVDARWVVIGGDPGFFNVTKRIHNHLHGSAGDGGELGPAEREIYDRTLLANAAELAALVQPGDIVFLHDPQTGGLVDAMRRAGAIVVWRCHVGLDLVNDIARGAWDFLRPAVVGADAFVFSRAEFVWDPLPRERVWIVPPSIDAFSPKNQDLSEASIQGIFVRAGLGAGAEAAPTTFLQTDGTPGRVDRSAEVDQDAPVPAGATLVTQVSRWDALKDPLGVLRGFAEHLDDPDVHLLLAGPAVAAVADDPEAQEVLEQARALREGLPPAVRSRIHLASLPMSDIEENAAIVNAIQRRSDVIVQKSLAEGFGLTVAEAMWKASPVVASGRGGIQDQITDGEHGLLLGDPTDLEAFGGALRRLIDDPALSQRLGAAARLRVQRDFLGTRHLLQYLDLLAGLLELS